MTVSDIGSNLETKLIYRAPAQTPEQLEQERYDAQKDYLERQKSSLYLDIYARNATKQMRQTNLKSSVGRMVVVSNFGGISSNTDLLDRGDEVVEGLKDTDILPGAVVYLRAAYSSYRALRREQFVTSANVIERSLREAEYVPVYNHKPLVYFEGGAVDGSELFDTNFLISQTAGMSEEGAGYLTVISANYTESILPGIKRHDIKVPSRDFKYHDFANGGASVLVKAGPKTEQNEWRLIARGAEMPGIANI